MLVIRLVGKAKEIFPLFAILAEKYPDRKIEEILRKEDTR